MSAAATDASLATLLQKLSDEIQNDVPSTTGSTEDGEQQRAACAQRVFAVLQGVLRHCTESTSGGL